MEGKKMNELTYVASPYTSEDPEVMNERYKMVTAYITECVNKGEVVISPVMYCRLFGTIHDRRAWADFWPDFCLLILVKCEYLRVVKMDGWKLSVGVSAEISFARDHGILIEYIDVINGKFYKPVLY